MSLYPPSLTNMIRQFAKLPGIGEKTAERLAMHVLSSSREDAEKFSSAIVSLKKRIRLCSLCYGLSDDEICHFCSDPGREQSTICVVEQPADMAAIERSGVYHGIYHVLQGVLSPMNNVGPEDIRIPELLKRVLNGNVAEVVLATGTGVEGEATAAYLSEELKKRNVNVTRIASGVPLGGDLKYVDGGTLKIAMERRHNL